VSLFDVHNDLVESRARLKSQVEAVLLALDGGRPVGQVEREQVDLNPN
jgi:hypothetical protein